MKTKSMPDHLAVFRDGRLKTTLTYVLVTLLSVGSIGGCVYCTAILSTYICINVSLRLSRSCDKTTQPAQQENIA